MYPKPSVLLLFSCLLSAALALYPLQGSASGKHPPIVIAHRGASGYLPEHTLEAKALAYAMKADYIEQDLVLSKDNHLIVMHDIYLDNITDVTEKFPRRAREDGHFYTIDFTLAELKELQVSGPFLPAIGHNVAKYSGRFPLWKSRFELATFEEELELIQGLNQSLGYDTGIYPEIKKPYFHRAEGRDISLRVLETLKRYGYTSKSQKVFVQSFDAEELQRIKRTLMPQLKIDLPLVQLIAETRWGEKRLKVKGQWVNYDYDWMLTTKGLETIAEYAAGIGPWFPMLVEQASDNGAFRPNATTTTAQKLGLKVHPFTFRADPQQVPGSIGSFEDLVGLFVNEVRVDGVFTDHPDKVRNYIAGAQADRAAQEKAAR
ncbi:glycerophosphodiester phosphodiesterase [Microbulbifer hydrolyticus]|uniref:glycerophosphodiester phosphodiesterase n=1 Tax=Microbulbifer hydrolyticus TaxID=48074 RepID=A0A6P1T926_9GAMM|nr:glycerophosphodiester phosphodiesterase [Microbulbifer hydrolyticus]MBB5212901.1 glycerophosphoryl diester phosphodiesterase [Microbulbifer hydrolyticus]QHQ38311.1 glycerophosphodiester phosphodiesterase [Microbulbifer hydrolyticus]